MKIHLYVVWKMAAILFRTQWVNLLISFAERSPIWYSSIWIFNCCIRYCSTVYPKKYAHGFCFAVLCCGYTLTHFPISIRLTSLALWPGMPGKFPRHRLQRKPRSSDPGMHHGTCVTHVPWCMSGSLNRGCGENVPGIPGACATRNFTYLARGPCYRKPINRHVMPLLKQ